MNKRCFQVRNEVDIWLWRLWMGLHGTMVLLVYMDCYEWLDTS
jgi:hypothetical protein